MGLAKIRVTKFGIGKYYGGKTGVAKTVVAKLRVANIGVAKCVWRNVGGDMRVAEEGWRIVRG